MVTFALYGLFPFLLIPSPLSLHFLNFLFSSSSLFFLLCSVAFPSLRSLSSILSPFLLVLLAMTLEVGETKQSKFIRKIRIDWLIQKEWWLLSLKIRMTYPYLYYDSSHSIPPTAFGFDGQLLFLCFYLFCPSTGRDRSGFFWDFLRLAYRITLAAYDLVMLGLWVQLSNSFCSFMMWFFWISCCFLLSTTNFTVDILQHLWGTRVSCQGIWWPGNVSEEVWQVYLEFAYESYTSLLTQLLLDLSWTFVLRFCWIW